MNYGTYIYIYIIMKRIYWLEFSKFSKNKGSRTLWRVGCLFYYKLIFLNMIFGFCVFFFIYEVEKNVFFEEMFQKCEQFSYELLF